MANFVDGALQSIAQPGNRCTFLSPALLVRRLLFISADLLLFSSRTDCVSASSPISVTKSHISLSNGNRSRLTQFCCGFFWFVFIHVLNQELTFGSCDFCYRREAEDRQWKNLISRVCICVKLLKKFAGENRRAPYLLP